MVRDKRCCVGICDRAVFPSDRPIIAGQWVHQNRVSTFTIQAVCRERVGDGNKNLDLCAGFCCSAFIGRLDAVIPRLVSGQNGIVFAVDVAIVEGPGEVGIIGWVQPRILNHFGAVFANDYILQLGVGLIGCQDGEGEVQGATEVAQGDGEVILSWPVELILSKQAL